jgi:twitching motility two-component system response regulator PilG
MSKKIMVIDDSSTICKSAALFLSNSGFDVISADNGFDALSIIVEEKPDLIFIDVMMPKLDGLQTCQILKKNPEYQKIPVVFLSSKDSEFDKARGFLVGAEDYLTKPFTKEQITSIVNKYVGS